MNLTEYQNYHEDKKHTLTEFPYNLYPCSIPLDFTFVPLHWHSELEIIVIKKGSGIISVDFQRQTVTSGDIIFILPGRLHSIEQDGTNSMEYENIILQPELLITGEDDLCAERFIRPLMNNQFHTETFFSPSLPYYAQLSECIRQLDFVCSLKKEGWQLAVKGCLFQFLNAGNLSLFVCNGQLGSFSKANNVVNRQCAGTQTVLLLTAVHKSTHWRKAIIISPNISGPHALWPVELVSG